MDIETFREYCLSFRGVTESFPFGEDALVFKVKDKMFALTHIDDFKSFNVKCDPTVALELRETYESVLPGYHMNKKHWNTVVVDGKIPDDKLKEWVMHSYDLVVAKLPSVQRLELNNL
ncbi:MAG: MmcQ/YjbR family DNA-binding protein [Balneolales bacterium]